MCCYFKIIHSIIFRELKVEKSFGSSPIIICSCDLTNALCSKITECKTYLRWNIQLTYFKSNSKDWCIHITCTMYKIFSSNIVTIGWIKSDLLFNSTNKIFLKRLSILVFYLWEDNRCIPTIYIAKVISSARPSIYD